MKIENYKLIIEHEVEKDELFPPSVYRTSILKTTLRPDEVDRVIAYIGGLLKDRLLPNGTNINDKTWHEVEKSVKAQFDGDVSALEKDCG